ncbi:hypothetical protein M422DRAFT_276666 [Sphaerobolus stellatus SS14]|uniref:Unplaced genomic scaffold SPHSTscaffold_836, whole genome shotgun sequence n=1 Tax=Sphaerobolus stellatus (strain SS14) TaxID=990650 RepID=A0A0C9TLX8_SPHS4|nr:hypothetical protein M422DRAFT_276666 [Sphaerobolus stellatus SS14]
MGNCFSVHIPSVPICYTAAQGTGSHSPASSCAPTAWPSSAFGGRNNVAIASNANGDTLVLVCSAPRWLPGLPSSAPSPLPTHTPQILSPGGRTIDLLRELLGWSDCLTALIVLREFKAHPLHIHIDNLFFIRN